METKNCTAYSLDFKSITKNRFEHCNAQTMESITEEQYTLKNYQFLMELIAGGCCGLAVDGILFPIDTCKTRLQSEKGFWR